MPNRGFNQVLLLVFAFIATFFIVFLVGNVLRSSPTTAQPLAPGVLLERSGPLSGDIGHDTLNFPLELRAGMVIEINATCGRSATIDPQVWLLAPGGATLAYNDDDGPQACAGTWRSARIVNFRIPSNGTHTIRLRNASLSSGDYTLTVRLVSGG